MLINLTAQYAVEWLAFGSNLGEWHALSHHGSNTIWLPQTWITPELDREYLVVTNAYDGDTSSAAVDKVISELIDYEE